MCSIPNVSKICASYQLHARTVFPKKSTPFCHSLSVFSLFSFFYLLILMNGFSCRFVDQMYHIWLHYINMRTTNGVWVCVCACVRASMHVRIYVWILSYISRLKHIWNIFHKKYQTHGRISAMKVILILECITNFISGFLSYDIEVNRKKYIYTFFFCFREYGFVLSERILIHLIGVLYCLTNILIITQCNTQSAWVLFLLSIIVNF